MEQLHVIVEKDTARTVDDVQGISSSSSSKRRRSTSSANKDSRSQNAGSSSGNTEAVDYRQVDVLPMAAKHAASAPYHIFYTTIASAKETHTQPYSITFQEILDPSLGELECSLQINFLVDKDWLLEQYNFAGYSEKKLTILYGLLDNPDLRKLKKKENLHVNAHHISMTNKYGTHHTKMMILCYEDGSLRVVISTANLRLIDWENTTQGLWFSPCCPELPSDSGPHDGESPTHFKQCLLRYLEHYHLDALNDYVERVKGADFSHINVFLVASVPGSHSGEEWGMIRVGSLLGQHCRVPAAETGRWPLLAQASSIVNYGNDPTLWLTGHFLNNFSKIMDQAETTTPPELKLIYPSLENVIQSHDGLDGGGDLLSYKAEAHSGQPWLKDFLYQWRAESTCRDKAMPHIKTYTRTSPDNKMAAFYLLTSANMSKGAWGYYMKKGPIRANAKLQLLSYEAGVLLLPTFVINKDYFPLDGATDRLVLAYDLPSIKYTDDMSPWVTDYHSMTL